MAKRFASHTPSEIIEKRANVVPKNTIKGNQKSAKMLRDYLKEKKQALDFENFDAHQLNEVLSHFYLDLRKIDGELYKSSSLENTRYGLNRYLKAPPFLKTFDIIKDPEFYSCNESFKTAMAELKKEGRGDVEHYPCIEDCDIKKLYNSVHLSTETPCGLLNKVQMDIRLYFCRRGLENMAQMTKDTFCVSTDPNTGLRYVKKAKDELVKNRRSNEKENFGGCMVENKDSPLCPVASFQKYITKLNPENTRLWQRPRETFLDSDPIWYTKQPCGKDSLSSFMSKLSKKCDLSRIYTNHSIRVTGTSILFKNNFVDSQIMSVTGHKSVNSLAVYHRVSEHEKLQMSRAIQNTVNTEQPCLPAPPIIPMLPAPPTQNDLSIVSSDTASGGDNLQLQGVNIDDLFDDMYEERSQISSMVSMNKTTVNVQQRRANFAPAPESIFQNCSIGTVQIIYKS
ncbi:uncharacterized protein LOC134265768 [Saccostrea cucullata]|uniref:uncharacterized protein LOC134265768 n=1 Tax=Saccostrea cuccullata TaxID=36930 RepID=UPI002ED47245